ncbi:uncharacterized protein LOC127832272 [Dreissena polymorpha]|uniref:B box-type domain-containing protein n=1 Tax=Dreissena polymorpha TaxID=45954 RepID=A0A9D4GJ21_DREPO|nr:uncharacterized protein LOC127832272 [Dreissena polymorpha]KAH3816329.1 hypothetical protein DPMN_117843 [Dreissena polymorpha]
MASNFESSIQRGSDLFFDFPCFTCQENDRNTEAAFYCPQCSKFYCCNCVEHHNNLYKKHSTLGKDKINIWPEATVDLQEQCREHKGEKLTALCEDHNQLLCHVCHIHTHKNCTHVVLITDKVKALQQGGEFKQLSAMLDTFCKKLNQKKDDFEESIQFVDKSHKQILEEINTSHTKITNQLEHLKRETIKELDTLHATLKSSIQTDITHCNESVQTMNSLIQNLKKITDKSEILHLRTYSKCLDHSIKAESFFKENSAKKDIQITFQLDTTIDQILSTMPGLGKIYVKQPPKRSIATDAKPSQDEPKAQKPSSKHPYKANPTSVVNNPDQVFHPVFSSSKKPGPGNQSSDVKQSGLVSSSSSLPDDRNDKGAVNKPKIVSDPNQVIRIKSKTAYPVAVRGNIYQCYISGICETAAGDLLIIDKYNKKVMLLDKTYKVEAVYDLPDFPESMCNIDYSLVAVTLDSEVHFIRVTNRQLVKDRTLQLQHECRGIAHHQGSLYITSLKALYHYTVDGTQVMKMYENPSQAYSVRSCAVSPDGDRIHVLIYVTKYSNQLVTLSRDGKVISTLIDPALVSVYSQGIHVTEAGQVLVCVETSNEILQVDKDGTRILAVVVTQQDGVTGPMSVCYSTQRGTLIVGMNDDDYIMVIMTK